MLEKRLVKEAIQRYVFVFLCGFVSMIIIARYVNEQPISGETVRETVKAEIIVRDDPEEKARYMENAEQTVIDAEARYIARVLYGTALHNTQEQQKSVVWCILNRVDSTLYPNSVKDVCTQESQWMGYSEENPIIQNLFDLAKEQLQIWHKSDVRPMSDDFLFLTWSDEGIELRTTFNKTSSTRYWIVK